MRSYVACLLVAAGLSASPALAEPVVKAAMPAINATLAGEEIHVRLEHGVLGAARSLQLRTLVVTARDAAGKVVGEAQEKVSRRMTYATVKLTPAFAAASSVVVSVR